MPFELWGVSGSFGLTTPGRPLHILLLLLYAAVLAASFYRNWAKIRRLSPWQWGVVLGLGAAAFLLSQLFPLRLPFASPLTAEPTALIFFAAAPIVVAGFMLPPAAVLLVGLAAGLGRAWGQTHLWFDLFHLGLAGWMTAVCLQQAYQGRFFRWLRHPLLAGAAGFAAVLPLIGLSALVSGPAGRGLAANVDVALTETAAQLLPLLVQGLIGGGIAALILRGLPHLRPSPVLVPPPYAYSLRRQLLSRVALFGVLLVAVLVTAVFLLTTWAATTLVANQMAYNAEVVAAEAPQFQNHLRNLLAQADAETLLSQNSEVSKESLGQMFRADPFYRRILLVNPDQSIRAIFPEDAAEITLSTSEKEAVAAALSSGSASGSAAETGEADAVVSFVVPVADETGAPTAVLVGRVAELSLRNLIIGLQGTAGEGVGFIVDENNKIIAHTDSGQLLADWPVPDAAPGKVFHLRDAAAGRHDLVYTLTTADLPWTIVTAVPYTIVLNQVGLIGGPLALLLIVVTTLLYGNLAYFGQETTRPITELVAAARTIAAGGRWQPSPQAERHDEVGQLHRAFNQMHQSRQKKLHELSLLLDVSNDVSHHLEINQGMPAILRGALRGTGASGARAVVLNPIGSYPLVFGEGPAANSMAVLDRAIMTRLRAGSELALDSPAEIKETLSPGLEPPVLAVVAIPLRSQERFMGVIWLGYRQAHSFDPAAGDLLKALAGQATVLVENARLFSLAEGGRRRLAAVLASATNAVIVTDQTDRIMLVNPAMAQIFGLSPTEVVNRPARDVFDSEEMVAAITGPEARTRNQEVPTPDGKTFYANVSIIRNHDGVILGRVAVLHDITTLKEIDAMKSDFVQTVSHDLRSPLTYMRGYVTMLPMVGGFNEKQQVYSDKILAGIDHMSQLVEDLLDLGRIEAGVTLHQESFAVKSFLADIAELHWSHAHMAGVKLAVKVEPEGLTAVADIALLRQAVTNLVMNGIKYAPQSGDMQLLARQADGKVIISVRDRGPGIPPQEQLRLFEKFYRVKARGSEKIKGSGLGLAIVRSIAERHGGSAWCQSEQGKGSTFSIAIPLTPGASGQTGQ